MRVLHQSFKGNEPKGLVFRDGEAQRSAKLLAVKVVFGRRASPVGIGGIKNLAAGQRWSKGERIAGVKHIAAEKTEQASMHNIAASLGDDIDGCAARAAQLR